MFFILVNVKKSNITSYSFEGKFIRREGGMDTKCSGWDKCELTVDRQVEWLKADTDV